MDCTMTEEPTKDHCNLDVLNSATLVENTRARFQNDEIYTYISQLLIAVNPFNWQARLAARTASRRVDSARARAAPRRVRASRGLTPPPLSPSPLSAFQVSQPLYAESLLVKYRGKEQDDMPPHVYGIAEQAYQKMKARIVVTHPEFRKYADSIDQLRHWLSEFFALFEGGPESPRARGPAPAIIPAV